MLRLAKQFDRFTLKMGQLTNSLIVFMVAVTAAVALLRYLFDMGWIWAQELVTYFHALFFLGAISLGLLKDGHVRVDIFYRPASIKSQAKIDLFGSFFLTIPFCLLILFESFHYVASSWRIFEGSRETGGIPAVFLLKGLILWFAVNLLLQAVSQIIKAVAVLRGEVA